MSASGALLRSVSRVDVFNLGSVNFGLIFQEKLQAIKAPRVESPTLFVLAFADFYTVADMGQIFENNRGARLDRCNNALRKHMIAICAETVKLSARLSDVSFGRFRAFRLQGCSENIVSLSNGFPSLKSKEFIVAGYGWAINAKVNSNNFRIVHVASLDDLPRDKADDYVCYSNQSNLSPYAPDKLIEFAKVKIHEPAPTPKNRQERRAQAAQRTKKKH